MIGKNILLLFIFCCGFGAAGAFLFAENLTIENLTKERILAFALISYFPGIFLLRLQDILTGNDRINLLDTLSFLLACAAIYLFLTIDSADHFIESLVFQMFGARINTSDFGIRVFGPLWTFM